MSINKEEYIESMRRLEFSDETKEKMIGNLTKISTPGNGGVMKKGIKAGKAVIIAAACVMIFGVTAAAAGIATMTVSHNRLGSRTDNFEKLSKLEKEIGFDVVAKESFSNGYMFDYMEIQDMVSKDDNYNDIEKSSGMSINYVKEGSPDVSVYMDPSTSDFGVKNAQESREVNGITLYYSYDEYLFLPASDGESATEEELKRQEIDPHFNISYGSDERETSFVSSVFFIMDGVTYDLMSFDTNMTSEEMLDMAEEIITAR